jgi:hypothetical protein
MTLALMGKRIKKAKKDKEIAKRSKLKKGLLTKKQ